MDIEAKIVAALGPFFEGRVYPNLVEQGKPIPAVVYKSNREPISTLLNKNVGTKVIITVTVVADSFDEARNGASVIRDVLARQPDLAISPDTEDGDSYDQESKTHQYTMAYMLWDFNDN
jgi:hypothetical protein